MSTYGFSVIETIGRSIQVSADGKPEMKSGGITLDWGTVTALAADTTYLDGETVLAGQKVLRYGQVVAMMGVAEVGTVEFTGGPTAGSAVLTLPAGDSGPAQSTTPLAFNAAAADVQAALQALGRIGPNGVTVTRAGSGTAGAPYVFTATFSRTLGDVPALTATHTFTGGTTPTVTIATTTPGTGGGKYGPVDFAATDGRQTLENGRVFILNETVRELDVASDHPPALEGGKVYLDRIIQSGAATHSLAAGPTLAELLAVMPRLRLVRD
jgi:hypothetical protein